jgi:LysM repeat protein
MFQNEDDNYTVKSGDTLISIASLHKTSIEAIMDANGLTSDQIRAGQVLTIPTDAPSTVINNMVGQSSLKTSPYSI